jgi:hypothetical protein
MRTVDLMNRGFSSLICARCAAVKLVDAFKQAKLHLRRQEWSRMVSDVLTGMCPTSTPVSSSRAPSGSELKNTCPPKRLFRSGSPRLFPSTTQKDHRAIRSKTRSQPGIFVHAFCEKQVVLMHPRRTFEMLLNSPRTIPSYTLGQRLLHAPRNRSYTSQPFSFRRSLMP